MRTPGVCGLLGLLLLCIIPACERQTPPPNIILISLDTTRADHLGCYGRELASTPALDRFAERALLLENAVTPIPVTLPAHLTMLTGRTPLGHGVRDNGSLGRTPGAVTLAELLAPLGYTRAAFVSAFVLNHRFDVSAGFEHFDDELDLERPAAETTARAVAYLESGPLEPLFLWVHYFDPHDPLTPPEAFAAATRGTLYDAEISAMDAGVGELLAALEAGGYAEDAHILIVADHGEGRGERHGYLDHGLLLYEEANRVPFLWRRPGQRHPKRSDALVGTVDILPTLADLLGLPVPEGTEGVSVRPLLEGDAGPERDGLYCETLRPYLAYEWSPLYAWRMCDRKYIAAPRPELYDLRRDPRERENLAAQLPGTAAELRTRLIAYRQRWRPATEAPPHEISEADRAALESLGYVQGRPRRGAPRGEGAADLPEIGELEAFANPIEHIGFEAQWIAARRLARREAWDAAVDTLQRILDAVPESRIVPRFYAEALHRAAREAEARPWIERYLTYRPDDHEARLLFCEILIALGDVEVAAAELERVPASFIDADVAFMRIRLAVLRGAFDRARAALEDLAQAAAGLQAGRWERIAAQIAQVERWGVRTPARGDSALTRQIEALLDLRLGATAEALLREEVPGVSPATGWLLRGRVARARHRWCDAADAFGEAAALGADPQAWEASRREAQRRCRRARIGAGGRPGRAP
ncbi:MAG: sulfatase-like hydrolase/transferase [Candidatus Eisenbacteria bacterium]|nr:sulfatase-like hydrolase/transferase [Candidatus Eisenbacteria bacterium]